MAWTSEVTSSLTIITTEQTFKKDGSDWKIALNPGEIILTQFFAEGSGSTDTANFRIYESAFDSPGAVPLSQSMSGSDWSLYNEIAVSLPSERKVWQSYRVSGTRWAAITVRRSGTTDTINLASLKIARDNVDA